MKFSIFNFQFSFNFQSLKIKNLDFIANFKFQISNGIWLLVYWFIGLLPACRRGRDNSRLRTGFSLVELLVVVALMGVIGTLTTQIFFIGFKSLAKGEIVKEVKQNGDYALSVIDRMVRNAADFSDDQVCNVDKTSLSIVNPDSFTTIFDCSGSKLSSISASIPDVTPTGIPMTSDKVVVQNCSFRVVCPTPPLSPKYVFVNFTLNQGVVAGQPTPLPENSASIEYSGTFSLGRYK